MLLFDAKIHSGLLSQYVGQAIDEAFAGDGFESHGVTMKLLRRGPVEIRTNGDSIDVKLASDIEVSKEMGLFSSEITGTIDIDILLDYDVSEHFHLSIHSDITGHSWVEKPRLEMGVLNVSVEKLTELALNHYESLITGRIDQALRERIRLRDAVNQRIASLRSALDEYDRFGLGLYIQPRRLMMERPAMDGDFLRVRGGLVLDAEIGEADPFGQEEPTFQWLTTAVEGSLSYIDMKLSESVAVQFVLDQLADQEIGGKPVEVIDASVRMSPDTLAIQTKISSPIKADVHVSGIPAYAESDQMIDLNDPEVRVDAESILYRISAPLVNKFVESKINDFFPVGLAPFLERIKTVLNKEAIHSDEFEVGVSVAGIRMSSLSFESGRIQGRVQLTNAVVDIKSKVIL